MIAEIRIPRNEIKEMRAGNYPMTFEEIGNHFGVTRQRIWQIWTDWSRRYSKTDQYKMYRRHTLSHKIGARPYKSCEYCNFVKRSYQ